MSAHTSFARIPSLFRGRGFARRKVADRRRASLRPRVERLETRLVLAPVPLTVTITGVSVPSGSAHFKAAVTINGNTQDSPVEFGSSLFVFWPITQTVDDQSPANVSINLFDEGGTGQLDIDGNDGDKTISLVVDPLTGFWKGDLAWPKSLTQGNGGGDGRIGSLSLAMASNGIDSQKDTDGDGLPDLWETFGLDYDATRSNGVDMPLNTRGANPNHKDLFVEVDAMQTRAPIALPGITSATNTAPIVVTASSNGLTSGTRVTIAGVGGNTAANGTFTVTRVSDNQFSLDGSNGTGSGVYTPNTGSWSLADLVGTGLATNTSLDLTINAFLHAPVSNPDGVNGIRLHLQMDELSLPFASWDQDFNGDGVSPYGEDTNANGTLDAGEDTNGNGALDDGDAADQDNGAAFKTFANNFRQQQFGTPGERANPSIINAKEYVYRYAIFADKRVSSRGTGKGVNTGSSGIARASDFFIITLGSANGGTAMQQSSTFMHEFGHTLILQHGGGDGTNNKPNYYSVMNYTWQFANTGNANMDASWKLDYSIGNLPDLTENNLNEGAGIGGLSGKFVNVGVGLPPAGGGATTQKVVAMSGPVDWSNSDADGNGNASDDTGVSADINFDGTVSTTPFKDYNDWGKIAYSITDAKPRFIAIFGSGDQETEFTMEDWQNLTQQLFFQMPYGNGSDHVTLRRNGGSIEVVDDGTGNVLASRLLSDTKSVRILGVDGEEDQLTIDFTGGNPIPSEGVAFSGGAGAGNDRLVLKGTPPGTPVYTPDSTGNSQNGRISMGSSFVDFTGLEFAAPVAPRVTSASISPGSVNENQQVTLSVNFVDPGSLSSHSVQINWRDGSPLQTFSLSVGARSFDVSHVMLDDNPTGTASDTVMVTATITDNDGLSGGSSPIVHVSNVAPQLKNLAVTSAIDENGSVTLTGTIVDPGTLDTFTLVVDWGDPLSPNNIETYTFSASSSGTQDFTLTHQYLDDNPTATPQDNYTIKLKLTDDDTGSDSASLQTLVRNVAPVVTAFTSDATDCGDKAEGDTVHVTGTFTDVGTLDSHAASIDWGDGTVTTATIVEAGGSGTVAGSHPYSAGGIYRIIITLNDDDTGVTQARTVALITGVGILNGQLQIVGTKKDDDVKVDLTGNGRFKVQASFLPEKQRSLPVAGVTSIVMVLCDGDDTATVAGNITLPTLIDGDEGNDRLNGGNGPNVLIGGDGNDQLTGGSSNDMLIGGTGADRIVGNNGDDILVAGSVAGPVDPIDRFDQLLGILLDWNLTHDRSLIRPRLSILGDNDADVLTGSAGIDWFFYDTHEDKATDLKNEAFEDIG